MMKEMSHTLGLPRSLNFFISFCMFFYSHSECCENFFLLILSLIQKLLKIKRLNKPNCLRSKKNRRKKKVLVVVAN